MRSKFVENSCASVQMSIRVNSMEVQNDIIVVGEKQWVHKWQSQPRCQRARVDSRYRDGHSARLLRFPDSSSGHTVVSSSSLVLSVFFS